MHLKVLQRRFPVRLHKQVLHSRLLVPFLLVTAACRRVIGVQFHSARPDSDVTVAPHDVVLVVSDRSGAALVVLGRRLFLQREHFLVAEGEHQSSAVVDVAQGLEGRFCVPCDDLT